MPEFRPPSYGPMDREYHNSLQFEGNDTQNIEEPIVPISEIGQTIPEKDPSGRFKTFIQQAQASIRMGVGKLQLAMNVPHTSPMGGRFKAYGKEVREALREVSMANQVKVAGVEMPTSSMTNMSGYDPQHNRFSDEVRKDHLDEVKDAIKFVAEACDGGSVDIVSWEYDRPINDAVWNKDDEKLKRQLFRQPGEMETVQVVDKKTGAVTTMRKGETWHLPFKIPEKGKPEDIIFDKEGNWQLKEVEGFEKGRPILDKWEWKQFKDSAELINQRIEEENKEAKYEKYQKIAPETLLVQMQLEGQKRTAVGYAGTYGLQAERRKKILDVLDPVNKQFDTLNEEQRTELLVNGLKQKGFEKAEQAQLLNRFAPALKNKKEFSDEYAEQKTDYTYHRSLAEGQMQQVKELEERQKRFTAVSDYAVQKAVDTYAEAGIAAMQETHNKGAFMKDPIHVGPEIGWPQFYGSHPEEFVDLIRKARKEMVHKLVLPFVDENGKSTDKNTGIQNQFYQEGLSAEEANEQAQTHIKGVFDTSHLGMWLRNFRTELPWDDRVKKFNEWFTGQVKWMADINKKEQIIGAVQAVDSATGAHAHLPPGQGILPVVDAVKILKENGFRGFIVSEGHEEEHFGEGRILLKAWEKFGSHFDNPNYRPSGGAPMTWNAVQNSYFGKTYSPMFMFGAYAPSNEFKLWSEVPLE